MQLNNRALHQLWYSSGESGLIGIPFTDEVDEYWKMVIGRGIDMLSFKDYWTRYAQFMLSGSKQAYFGYNGFSYWVIESSKIDKDNYFVDGEFGYHVIEMRTDGLGYTWLPTIDEGKRYCDGHYGLLFEAWDNFMGGEGQPISEVVAKLIQKNVEVSEKVHEEMTIKMPPGKTWTNKSRKDLQYPWAES